MAARNDIKQKELVTSLRKNEYKSILGKNNRGLYFLTAILALTFISLGHVLEGIQVLEKSMNNPFTNWVNIDNIGEDAIEAFNKKIENNYEELGIRNIQWYTKTQWEILLPNLDRKYKVGVRNVDINDPIYNNIIDPENILYKNEDASFERCGVIVKEKMLRLAGYTELDKVKKLSIVYPNRGYDHNLFIDVVAIVKDLPNEVDMITPNRMASLYSRGSTFLELGSSRSIHFLTADKIELGPLKDTLQKYNVSELLIQDDEFVYYKDSLIWNEAFLENKISYLDWRDILKKLTIETNGINYSPHDCGPSSESFSKSYVAYNFNDLTKISEFSKYAESEGVDIPLHQVKSKENFLLVSRIAGLFILLLVFFSSASILLYLKNTLQNHLENIKPNLGTLKAFGLNDRLISNVYLYILYRFFIIASFLAFIIAVLYHVFVNNLDINNLFYNIFNLEIFIVWLIIGFILFLFYRFSISKILDKAPGDLIYNR